MSRKRLVYDRSEISKTAEAYLEKRFYMPDYKSLWISIESLIDDISLPENDTIFDGVVMPKSFNWDDDLKLADVPAKWWKLMKFSPAMEKEIKAFWKKNPEGEVLWEA